MLVNGRRTGCSRRRFSLIALGLAGIAAAPLAFAQEYKIGVSAAITGPVASTYAPSYEGLKVYMDRLNERGGVNGRKVNMIYLNNQAAPPRAVADGKRLVDDEKVIALVNISASGTYAPMIADAKRSGTPLIFLGSAMCPGEVYPPKPDPLLFCSSFNMVGEDSKAIVQTLNDLSGGSKPKLALLAMDIPISRQGVDMIEKLASQQGWNIVGKVARAGHHRRLHPVRHPLQERRGRLDRALGAFTVGVAMFSSLSKLGWSGNYLSTASPTAERTR